MEVVFAILLVLGVLLAVVTVVGLGIWVLLSLIFDAWRRPESLRTRAAAQHSGQNPVDGPSLWPHYGTASA